jgi:hypothetical protein
LVSTAALNSLRHPLQTLDSAVAQWANGEGSHHLAQAVQSYLDPVLEVVRGFPPVGKDKYVKGTIAAAEAFQEAAQSEVDRLRSKIHDLTVELDAVKVSAAELRSRSDREVELFRERLVAEDSRLAAQRQRLDTALDGLQQTFAAAEAERARAHQATLDEHRRETTEAAAAAGAEAHELLQSQVADGSKFLKELAKAEDEARKLVGAIGLKGTSTGYDLYAEQQRKAANWMRGLAVAAFLFAFGIFAYTVLHGDGLTSMSWQSVLFRLSGSLALLAAGTYLARESAHHRAEERSARSKQLDLVALNPFISPLPTEEQQAIRAAAAKRLFTNSDSMAPAQSAEVVESRLVEVLIAALLDFAKSTRHPTDGR